MIVEVTLDDGEPRRYEVSRDDNGLRVRRADEAAAADRSTGGGRVEEGSFAVDVRRPEPGVYSLLIGDLSFEVFVREAGNGGNGGDTVVHLLNRTFAARALDARRPRLAKLKGGAAGIGRVTAPIPGRVVEILAPVGTEVKQGDGVLVLEAMKMENELKAPRDGTVATVEVEEGQGVEGGALLATIE